MKQTVLCTLLLLGSACTQNGDFDATGCFEATEITLSAEATGRILSLDVREGDLLEAGQHIGQIDSVQLYLQKLQIEQQQAAIFSSRPDIAKQAAALREQITKEQTEQRRIENLLRAHAATQKQLDDIQAHIRLLQSQLDALLSTLHNNTTSLDANASALALQIARIDDQLSKCRITSPISGTVLSRYAEAGEFASVGRPLLKLANLDQMYLRAYFTSDQLSELRLGQHVTVTADFGGNQRFDYEGTIVWIASESEFTPKTIQTRDTRANLVYAVKIAVQNDGRLKLGLYGEVKL